jgi:Subtilase family
MQTLGRFCRYFLALAAFALPVAFAADHAAIREFYIANGHLPDAVPGETLVKLKTGASMENVGRIIHAKTRWVLMKNPDEAWLKANAERWEANSVVRLNEPHAATPSTAAPSAQAAQSPTLNQVYAPQGWTIAVQGEQASIVVIGTGVDGTDTDLNVDRKDSQSFVEAEDDQPCVDIDNHDTFGAGIIAARGINGAPIGIAPGREIISFKIFSKIGADGVAMPSSELYSTMDEIGQAIGATGDLPGRLVIANLSFNAGETTVLRDIFASLESKVLFVVAAGNSGLDLDQNPYAPGNDGDLPNVISVAGVQSTGQFAGQLLDFSNYSGKLVNIAAPGDGITSTYPGNITGTGGGTSFSAPFVDGAADLAYEVMGENNPNSNPAYLKKLIMAGCAIDPWLVDPSLVQNGCMLNVYKTLKYATSGLPQQAAKPLQIAGAAGSWSGEPAAAPGDLFSLYGSGFDGDDLVIGINGLHLRNLITYHSFGQLNLNVPMDPSQFLSGFAPGSNIASAQNTLTICRNDPDGISEAGAKITIPSTLMSPAIGDVFRNGDGTITALVSGLGMTNPVVAVGATPTGQEKVLAAVQVQIDNVNQPSQIALRSYGVYTVTFTPPACPASHSEQLAIVTQQVVASTTIYCD